MIRTISYIRIVGKDVRLRTWFERDGHRIVNFAVTLELQIALDDWRAVTRIDTTGGTIHRDRLKPDGSYLTHREPLRLGMALDQAMTNAQRELTGRFEAYIAAFKKLLESDQE